MRRLPRLQTPVTIILAAILLAACGSSKSSTTRTGTSAAATQNAAEQTQNTNGDEVVARVGAIPITKAQVNHWMYALAASAFYRDSGAATIPDGLLSDPPDYPRCVSSLESASSKAPVPDIHESSVELLAKCRELYQAFKVDATGYLITTQQTVDIARQMGATSTPAKIQALFRQIAAREYPSAAAQHQYLTSHHRTVSDVLLETEISVLAKQVYPQLQTRRGRSRYIALRAHAVAETSCTAGYVVEGCKQFKGTTTYNTTPPSILIEQLSRSA